MLSVTEEKLVKLYEDLEAQGLNDTQKQMKEEGLYIGNINEAKLPQYNTRIVLANTKNQDRAYEDEEDSGDDGNEDFRGYRDQIKQASKQIVDAKTKKHQVKNKKNK
jgi:hypothetical protein